MDKPAAANRSTQQVSTQQIVENRLQQYARFGVDLGLDRIEALLAKLGNPQQQVPIIHVAGTNGKGSVCAYLASVLSAAGYRTGRYTSPHLINWTERICIDGTPISWAALANELDTIETAIQINADPDDAPVPTQFEVFTAAAWQHFARQQVEVAVVEVGLGGRLDATNVCAQPLATVIVSISRDHWQRLGNTLAEIAGEKAGILKPGVRAIAGPLPKEAADVVTNKAKALNAPLTWVTPAQEVSNTAASIPTLTASGIEYPQVLLGEHQKINSACAIAVLQSLRQQGWQISDEAIARGMATVSWPGRLQMARWQGHPLLIDGAHNTDAAQSLRAYVNSQYPNQAITWLMGMLDTKDHEGVLSALLRSGDRLHLVPVPGHAGMAPEALAAIAHQICPDVASVLTHTDLAAGLTAAATSASITPKSKKKESGKENVENNNEQTNEQIPFVLCGSLYLIGTFYENYHP